MGSPLEKERDVTIGTTLLYDEMPDAEGNGRKVAT